MKLNPLSWFAEPRAADEEAWSLGDDAVLQAFYGALAAVSSSGITVTQESALRSTAVLACLIVRAETFAALPVSVLRTVGRDAVQASGEPAYRLLAVAPNELMTAKEFWRHKQLTEDVAGNAFARVAWKGSAPQEIWPLYGQQPALAVDARTKRVAWNYSGDDFTPANAYPLDDLVHFKGPVLRTPFEGRSLIELASETIGVSIGSEQFFARLLGNGSHFPGYLETDRDLDAGDVGALREQLKGFSGIVQAGSLRIFDRGLKYKQNPMSLKDAQLTEQMRWQLQALASVFRVPMAMIGDLSTGTYANSEQQDLWLAKHTITPICANTEGVLRQRLFARRPDLYAKFNLDGLLRGDYKTRAEGDATLVRAGILSRDEARGHYDLNSAPGLEKFLAELNLGVVSGDGTITGPSAGAAAEPPARPAGQEPPPADPPPAAALLEPVMRDAVGCVRRRFERDGEKGVPAEETIAFAAERLAPVAEAYRAAGMVFDSAGFIAEALAGDSAATLDGTGGESDA